MTETLHERWSHEILIALGKLDEAAEIDDYRAMHNQMKIIRQNLDNMQDGMMEYLTAYLSEENTS